MGVVLNEITAYQADGRVQKDRADLMLASAGAAATSAAILQSQGFGCAFGSRVILAEVDLTVQVGTIHVLMGPVGTGKSTLLRSIAGLNQTNSRFQSWGEIFYNQQQLEDQVVRPRLVQQHANLLQSTVADNLTEDVRQSLSLSPRQRLDWAADYLQRLDLPELLDSLAEPAMELSTAMQRIVNIARVAATEPPLLMIDEPTSGLSDYDAFVVFEVMRAVSKHSALLVVLHNQKHTVGFADHVSLLAGGRIQESGSVAQFFDAPVSDAARQFVRTGSCAVASPDADPESLSEDVPLPPPLPLAARLAVQATAVESRAPRGFAWIMPGKLAGTPMPGAALDIDYDLASLRQIGITKLITLTEEDIDQAALKRHGLSNLHLPIYDREPPTIAQTDMLILRMDRMMQQGEVLAVHCLAGIGRTGTVLACWLIREGLIAAEALRRLRLIDPRYVQSDEQEQFLHAYEEAILKKIK